LLNFFQIIDIVGSTQARTPQKLSDLYEGFQFFTEFIVVFKPSCAGYDTLSSSMLTKCLTPIGFGRLKNDPDPQQLRSWGVFQEGGDQALNAYVHRTRHCPHFWALERFGALYPPSSGTPTVEVSGGGGRFLA
jgi:hypothetical protein